MQKYHNTIQEANGDVVITATVTVYNSVGGAIASIFDDNETTPLSNPFTISDLNYSSNGAFWFKAANGDYHIKVVNGANTTWLYDVTLFDFEDATAPNVYDKTTDPTINDDNTAGWEVGSRWINITTDEEFVALDVTTGAAIWDNATLTVDELGTMATQNANDVAITGGSASGLTSLGMVGPITTNDTIDGRFVALDGIKLDTVEENADVTDSVNVEAAGAVMESDTTTDAMNFVIDEDTFVSNLPTKVPTQQSVKTYVDNTVASNVSYQGGYDASTNTPNLDTSPTGVLRGHMWTCTVAGTAFFTVNLEVGDVLIAEQDDPTLESHWTVVNKNLDASSILAALLTVDGAGSGLDADLLDGADSAEASTPSTIVKRDANGDITADSFRMDDAADNAAKTNVMVGDASGNIDKQANSSFITNLGLAILASPAFTGNPTAPTQTAGNDSTRLATTEFVQAAVTSGASGFPAGTAMVFQQTAAPSTWTKSTTHNNKAFRVVSGTAGSGGSVTFTAAMNAARATSGGSVGNTSLSIAQLAAHTHSDTGGSTGSPSGNNPYNSATNSNSGTWSTDSTGSGASHGHTFTNPTVNMQVQYVDLIIATKDA